jgi:hypothetical protein
MSDRLTPLPHLIKSIRHRNWKLSGAMMELVDNSLQHGRATDICILIENGEMIGIGDNGIGIDDINRMFTLGDASAYGDLSNIGQYGVGATDAMIFLGERSVVETIRNGRFHHMAVNWLQVENSGEWPLRYTGAGIVEKKTRWGTLINITGLFHHYTLKGSETLARDLGLTFAPALRNGAQIIIEHRLQNGGKQRIRVEPFEPQDLTDIIKINGSISTARGLLKWNGRAGLSRSLVERHNGAHIAFAHRIIEITRDPFMGISAPTLYAEIQLDHTTPWKHQLSDHKDRVVRFRDELITGIHEAIKSLLEKAQDQATSLALLELTAQIEDPINNALKAAGALFIDPDEEAEGGGDHNNGEDADGDGKKKELRTPRNNGEPAKERPRLPTGIKIEYVPKATLEGRAFSWDVADRLMTIRLEKEMFSAVLGWPPKMREKHTVHLVVAFLSHAIEMLYWDETKKLQRAVSKVLYEQIDGWAGEREKIAPFFYNCVIEGVIINE